MAANADQLTEDTIQAVVTATVGDAVPITVAPASTATDIYRVVYPVAYAAAMLVADAERVAFAQSWLAARGSNLDALGKGINARRLPDETDDSFRANGPLLFTPNASFSAVDIDAGKNQDDEAVQLDAVRAMGRDEIYQIMRARFRAICGDAGLPGMMARLWAIVAYRMAELYGHLVILATDLAREEARYIGDTEWCYRYAARRVRGVLDAAFEATEWNQITLWTQVDDYPGRDGRNRKIVYLEGEALTAAQDLGQDYLPPLDRVTLSAPTLRVLPARQRPVPVEGMFAGTATVAEVQDTILEFFHDNVTVGAELQAGDLDAAVLAVSGVTAWSRAQPSQSQLEPNMDEVLMPAIVSVDRI